MKILEGWGVAKGTIDLICGGVPDHCPDSRIFKKGFFGELNYY